MRENIDTSRRNYLVSKRNYHKTKTFSENLKKVIKNPNIYK